MTKSDLRKHTYYDIKKKLFLFSAIAHIFVTKSHSCVVYPAVSFRMGDAAHVARRKIQEKRV